MLVVDASVVAPMVGDDGDDGRRYRSRVRGEDLIAPDLLRVEVLSVLRRQVQLGALTVDRAAMVVEDLLDLPIDFYPSSPPLLRLAWELRDNVSAYDAQYVALAESLDAPLITADARLGRAPGLRCSVEVLIGSER